MPSELTHDERRELLQLAFAGWLPEPDPDELSSDDWYTPPELVSEIDDWFGGIDLDPCWSPRSFVRPRVAYTEYEGTPASETMLLDGPLVRRPNGLGNPWHGNVGGIDVRTRFCNPPYSRPGPWIKMLADMHAGGALGELDDSIALIRIDTSTWWWKLIWQADAICWFYFRVPFVRPGSAARSQPRDHHALVYWGPRGESFGDRWGWLGHVTHRRDESVESIVNTLIELGYLRIDERGELAIVQPDTPVAREHELVAIDGIPASSYPFLPTGHTLDCGTKYRGCAPECTFDRCSKHGVRDCEDCAEAVTAVDEPVIELDARAEHPQAWPTVHCTCPTLPCPKHPHAKGGAR